MATLRSIPGRPRGPTYRGRIMIDSFRGVLRIRKWPKKRGPPRSARQAFWVDWFRQANRLAKYVDGMSMARAIAMTKGSGLYPRDVLLMAMRGRLYNWTTPDGWRWYSMAAIADISESLDVLAQTVGSVLVRAADRWRPPAAGILGDVLTNKGPGNAPEWQAPAGPGGLAQEPLAGTPIVPDGTKSQYDIDVSAYAAISLTLDNVGFAASSHCVLTLSTDGGLTFRAGATDYHDIYQDGATQVNRNTSRFNLARANATTGHAAEAYLDSLRAGRAVCRAANGLSTNLVRFANDFANFDGPITHIRLSSNGGSNFNAGTLRLIGLR